MLKAGDKVRSNCDFDEFLTKGKIYTVLKDQKDPTFLYLTTDDRVNYTPQNGVEFFARRFEKVEEEAPAWAPPSEALELFRKATEKPVSAKATQVGGTHYTKQGIQPYEYTLANGLGGLEHTVIKYVTRWKDKGGVEDLKKARHTLDFLIEWTEKNAES